MGGPRRGLEEGRMSIILTHRHFVVYPDGLTQELEWTPEHFGLGELVSEEQIGGSVEPGAKYLIKKIVDEDPGEYPHFRRYYLEKF
jgi:hypothetical protein